MRIEQGNSEGTKLFFRRGPVLWFVQVVVLALAASLLAFTDAGWATSFERVRLVRNFMANPVEMIIAEALGTLCILVGISGAMDRHDSLLDTVWGGYAPLFIGYVLPSSSYEDSFIPCGFLGEGGL